MKKSIRALASALGLTFSLAACGGGGHSASLPLPGTGSPNADSASRSTESVTPMISVPKTSGALAYTDSGRRASTAPVTVAITLRYNNQAQLDQFVANVSDPHSPIYRHFLTNDQFNATYAPTAQQEAAVVQSLQKAGFTITQRASNRTIVDASAPTSVVERYFSTEMHTVRQGTYGDRFANLKPATVPSEIAPSVLAVSLNNLVIVRTKVDQASTTSDNGGRVITPAVHTPRQGKTAQVRTDATNVLSDPGFESGGFAYWPQCGNVSAHVTTAKPHTGSYSEWSGSTTSEPNGDAGVCQWVTIPASGVLTFWVWQSTNETSTTFSYQEADLLNASGYVVDNLYTTVSNAQTWVQKSYNLSAYAGQSFYLYFGVHGDGTVGYHNLQYVDDVSLTNGSATPTPTPTATPTPAPTPTPVPTATPTPGSGCAGSAALNGPLSNSSGTLATGVAKPFDYPVQHGCNGAGYTAAVIIDAPVSTSYLNSYLSAAQVTHTGTVTNVAVDGGGAGDDAETDLDVQTIAGLAPAANIIVYHIGSLTDQHIEDAYNTAITDGKTSVVNSSFGGCESSDTAFESATNSIAQQGAATGVTFAASSGDTGSNECSGTKGVSAPAGDPYFTSVGGVNFTYTSAGVLTSVTAGSSSGDSTGGGVSTVVAFPTWQSGVAGMITSGRNQPDISLPFDPVAVYTGGAFGSYLGTSWSSPAFVALMIETNQLHATKAGWVNPTLYNLFKSTGYSSYYTPCTSGTNGAYSCNASQYNQVTGIGAPKGWALANAL